MITLTAIIAFRYFMTKNRQFYRTSKKNPLKQKAASKSGF
ncbi:hypothetical protein OAL24_01514 [Oenococcus sicerae]|nr:hypothetical protein OAL24_01514 [Oenococcus sicerae]